MSNDEKLIWVTNFNVGLNSILGTEYQAFPIYKSKGLLAHLLKRQHYVAAKYIDYLPEIIDSPDYIGKNEDTIEFVKCYRDDIYVCVKLDSKRKKHYVATMFEIKRAKIDSYVSEGRLFTIDDFLKRW